MDFFLDLELDLLARGLGSMSILSRDSLDECSEESPEEAIDEEVCLG